MTVDISQVTLDVITAIKEKGAVKFTYKDKDAVSYTHLTLPTILLV